MQAIREKTLPADRFCSKHDIRTPEVVAEGQAGEAAAGLNHDDTGRK